MNFVLKSIILQNQMGGGGGLMNEVAGRDEVGTRPKAGVGYPLVLFQLYRRSYNYTKTVSTRSRINHI